MIKPGVDLSNLAPQMAVAYTIACGVYAKHTGNTFGQCVITSASDGVHSPNSLHYSGKALDLRTKHLIPAVVPFLVRDLKLALGEQFDVVLETDHIHLEFDPKEPAKDSHA